MGSEMCIRDSDSRQCESILLQAVVQMIAHLGANFFCRSEHAARHGWAPTRVLVEDVVLVVASPLCLREITMLERLPHKMIFVVCPRAP